jgi:DNA polymerase III delta prime subunit
MILKHDDIIKKALASNNCPNLLIYGIRGIDKLSIIKPFLNDICDSPLNVIEKEKIIWESNSVYKIFNMEFISSKNIMEFFNIINDIIHTVNYYICTYRIIILNNFNNISHHIQTKLRVITEKYIHTTLFIFISDKLTSIIEPLRSRCLLCRIPGLTFTEKRLLSRPILSDKTYPNKSIIYDEIYKLNQTNEIINYTTYSEGILLGHQNIYKLIYDKIQAFVTDKSLTRVDIENIRNISYSVLKYNLYDIYSELLHLFLEDYKTTFKFKSKCIKLFADSESNYHKAYRGLIHVENLFLQIINLSRSEIQCNNEE